MNDYKIFTTFLLVFVLLVPLVFAPPAGETSVTITTSGGAGPGTGGQTNLKSDGASCSVANECTNSFCVHNICRSASTFCGDGSCDSGESCSSDDSACASGYACTNGCVAKPVAAPSGGAAAPTPTPTPTPAPAPAPTPTPTPTVTPPIQVVAVKQTITEKQTIQEVVTAIKPADLGVETIKIENLEVTKTGVAETTTTTQAPILEKVVEEAIKAATEEPAKQVLNEIKQAVSSGSSSPVSVSTTVEVFEVKEKTTEKTAFSSKITLTLKADKELKDVNIVEVIPKSVAASILEVVFLGEKPKILQADPIVQWIFPVVEEGETKYLSYQVAKKVEKLETKTVAVAEAALPEAKPEAPSFTYVYILLGAVVAVVVVYFLYKKFSHASPGKPTQFKYTYKPK